jgi:hypothetical protein
MLFVAQSGMAASQPEWVWVWEGIKMLVPFLLGLLMGKFAERSTQATRALERYLAIAEEQPEAQNEAAFRMGLLQRCGAAELSRPRLKKLAGRVVAHGLNDPLTGYDFFSDWRKDPYRLLRWANNKGINLSDEGAILRILAAEADAKR